MYDLNLNGYDPDEGALLCLRGQEGVVLLFWVRETEVQL